MPTALLPEEKIAHYNAELLAAKLEAIAALRRVIKQPVIGEMVLSTLKVTALTLARIPFITPYIPPNPRRTTQGPPPGTPPPSTPPTSTPPTSTPPALPLSPPSQPEGPTNLPPSSPPPSSPPPSSLPPSSPPPSSPPTSTPPISSPIIKEGFSLPYPAPLLPQSLTHPPNWAVYQFSHLAFRSFHPPTLPQRLISGLLPLSAIRTPVPLTGTDRKPVYTAHGSCEEWCTESGAPGSYVLFTAPTSIVSGHVVKRGLPLCGKS